MLKSFFPYFFREYEITPVETDLDIKDLENKSEGAINLIYENAIEVMKEINERMKIIGSQATWLLGLLMGFIVALSAYYFNDFGAELEPDDPVATLKFITGFLLIYYSILILFYMPKLLFALMYFTHSSPKAIISQTDKTDSKSIKISEIIELQGTIERNIEQLSILSKSFRRFIALFLASPLASYSAYYSALYLLPKLPI